MRSKPPGLTSTPLRILILTNSDVTEPTSASFIKELADGLHGLPELEVCLLGRDHRRPKLRSYLEFAFRVKKASPGFDVVHSHHGYTIILAWLAVCGRSKRVGTLLSDGLSNFRFKHKFLNRCLLKLAYSLSDALIVRNAVTQRMCPGSVVITSPVSKSKFFIKPREECLRLIGFRRDAKYIGFVISGDLSRPEKRYDLFMEVMANLEAEYTPLLINNVAHTEIVNYIGCCDFIMLTSDFEGSANVIKESILCGVPVISRPVGDAEHILSGVPGCRVMSEKEMRGLRVENMEPLPTRASVRSAAERRIPSVKDVADAHLKVYRSLC